MTFVACGCMKRRHFLSATAAGLALASCGQSSTSNSQAPAEAAPANSRKLVDLHRHLLSPGVEQAMKDQGLFRPQDEHTLAETLEEMDKNNVVTSILSLLGGPIVLDDPTFKTLSREGNEFMAKTMTDNKGRFRFFAMVPFTNIDATLAEIVYAMDTLKADGVSLLTSYGDKWVGDPYWAPVYEELNRRKAIVKTHPHEADCCRANEPGIGPALIEYGTDTTRAIARIIFSGTAAKYPDIRWIHSHLGGSFPYLMQRFANLAEGAGASRAVGGKPAGDAGTRPGTPPSNTPSMPEALPNGLDHEVKKTYFDTAQGYNPITLTAVKEAVPASQILFGTDWPYVDAATTFDPIVKSGVFDSAELDGIANGNIKRLIPSLDV